MKCNTHIKLFHILSFLGNEKKVFIKVEKTNVLGKNIYKLASKMVWFSDLWKQYYKLILMLLTLIYSMWGLVVIVVSILLRKLFYSDYIIDDEYRWGTFILFLLGFIVFANSMIGLYAIYHEKIQSLITFSGFFGVVVLVEISLMIVMYILARNVHVRLPNRFSNSLHSYHKCPIARQFWDSVQLNLHCCGVHRLQDWKTALKLYDDNYYALTGSGNDTYFVPSSCCDVVNSDGLRCFDLKSPRKVNRLGCFDLYLFHFVKHYKILLLMSKVLVCTQCLSSILWAMAARIKERKRKEPVLLPPTEHFLQVI